jgi:hypothetical protein
LSLDGENGLRIGFPGGGKRLDGMRRNDFVGLFA